MSNYELTFLTANEKDKEEMDKLLKSAKAKIINETKWGERALAYRIKKHSKAFYFTYNIVMPAENIADFKTKLGYNDKIIRYLLLKIEN
ncbi:MAG: 30S ribosomal protein S6 [Patescibacteria group bacterium]|nr:MAG: 30S ribosomal protein S6 [Patescibacteria group bacterium]